MTSTSASSTTSPADFSTEQRKTIAVIWGTYAFYYLGRLNLSPALPAIAIALGTSRTEVGLLGTVFFWVYAFGQFFSGELGNHFSPRKIVMVGLLTIVAANILFSFQQSLLIMLILWGINGLAQSTGWGPMLRILAERLSLKQRQRISTILPMSFMVGTAVTWAFVGWLVSVGSWSTAFLVPGIILLVVAVNWWFSGIDAPVKKVEEKEPLLWSTIRDELFSIRYILAMAFFLGFVQVGGAIWLPTYFADTGLFPEELVGLMAGIIPTVGIVGMYLSGILLHRLNNPIQVLIWLYIGSGVSLFLATITTSGVQILFVTIASLLLQGAFAVTLGSVPILLSQEGRASSVAGSVTAFANFGAGAAGAIVGAIITSFTWSHVFGVWTLFIVVALVFTRLDYRIRYTQ